LPTQNKKGACLTQSAAAPIAECSSVGHLKSV
jgi:hypothetical protein